jgi:hypothetical protein
LDLGRHATKMLPVFQRLAGGSWRYAVEMQPRLANELASLGGWTWFHYLHQANERSTSYAAAERLGLRRRTK